MNSTLTRLAIGLVASAAATCVAAQDIKLTSKSGGIAVNGKLISYDGKTYQIETELGRMTLADNDLICEGASCPPPKPKFASFSLIATDRVDRGALIALLRGYAKDYDKIYTQKGSYSKPELAEIAHRTDGLEASVRFKSGTTNVTFGAQASDTAIGFDAVKIVSTSNNLKGEISADTLKTIWAGEITDWSELGGGNAPIRLILPIYSDDLFTTTKRFDAALSAETITPSVEYFLSTEAIREAIRKDPNAIGLVYDTVEFNNAIAIDVGCSIAIAPSSFTIQSMQYPLSFTLNVNSNSPRPLSPVENLKDYMTTQSAQAIIADTGLVPLVGKEIGLSQSLQRLENALSNADGDTGLADIQKFARFASEHKRLATTLYFDQSGRSLDAQSKQVLDSLAELLETPRFSNAQVFAVGFSDSVGAAKDNLTISTARANTVKNALASRVTNVTAIGFGEVAPIGCNETDYGKSKNRRVEIWYQP